MKDCGIYMFLYKNYCYVGQSIRISKRIDGHKRMIKSKTHPNMDKISDYDINDIEFSVLEECNPSDLNRREKYYFDIMSKKYVMLNKANCGMSGDRFSDRYFLLDKTPFLDYVNGDFYIDNIVIEKKDGLYCLSQLVDFILDNSTYSVSLNNIINTNEFAERIYELYKNKGLDIPAKRCLVKKMKDLGIYKCVGARGNRKIFCDFGVFVTFAYMSCPPFGASVCMIIGKNL